jgi:hypothetical protein
MCSDLAKRRQRLPDRTIQRLDDKPTLRPGLSLYWTAFAELKSTRGIGMDIGSIPWTAVKQWCDEHDIRGDQRADVFHLVDAMDRAFLEWRARKQDLGKKHNKARGNGNQPSARSGLSAPTRRSGRSRRRKRP